MPRISDWLVMQRPEERGVAIRSQVPLKDLENKKVTTNGFGNKAAAIAMIKECKNRFDAIENKEEGLFSIRF